MIPPSHIARAATVGMFDGVHLGHRHVIRQLCAAAGSRSLVPTVFTFDRHPLMHIAPDRAPRLLSTVEQKSQMIAACGAREVVVLRFDSHLRELTAARFIDMLSSRYGVEWLLVGHDHRFGKGREHSFDDYRRLGLERGIVVEQASELILDGQEIPVCSSSVRKALTDGDIPLATRLLGHGFSIHGRVGHGLGIGHTIGFPTANLQPLLPCQQLPAPGVYAGRADVHGSTYPAMINIGTNPTVGADTALKIEAHLIGFSGDLYGSILSLTFTRRLRDERKFPSLEALTAQLRSDIQAVLGGS